MALPLRCDGCVNDLLEALELGTVPLVEDLARAKVKRHLREALLRLMPIDLGHH